MTGTKAFGLPAKDHDRFCTYGVLSELMAKLDVAGISHSEDKPHKEMKMVAGVLMNVSKETSPSGGTGKRRLTFELAGESFDVFAVAEDEIESWKTATEMLVAAARAFPLQANQKYLRIHLFRVVRDTLNMWQKALPPKGDFVGAV